MTRSNYYCSICLEGLRKTMTKQFKTASVPAEIRTEHHPSKSVEHYCYTVMLGLARYPSRCICR
jgi:hypothetical protein